MLPGCLLHANVTSVSLARSVELLFPCESCNLPAAASQVIKALSYMTERSKLQAYIFARAYIWWLKQLWFYIQIMRCERCLLILLAIFRVETTEALAEPLLACYWSLWECGGSVVADGRLLDLLRRVYCFGPTLMKMDLRQESTRHTDALDAVTR